MLEAIDVMSSTLAFTLSHCFQLSNLATDSTAIAHLREKKKAKSVDEPPTTTSSNNLPMESTPALSASDSAATTDLLTPTLEPTLAATPELNLMADLKVEQSTKSTDEKTSLAAVADEWQPTSEWIETWKAKLPLQTIMRLLQVLVPQVEKLCLEK